MPKPLLKYDEILKKQTAHYQRTLRDWMVYHQHDVVGTLSAWKGIRVIKPPQDLWVYQEMIHGLKPEVIVEIGSLHGGCTQYLADVFPTSTVVSVDIDRTHYLAKAPNIIDITGDSHTKEVADQVKDICKGKNTLVIHDGDHSKESVLKDIELYSPLVPVGGYFIVEDGIVDLFTTKEYIGTAHDGALHAIIEFINNTDEFVIDRKMELYLITYCPYGFLRRVSG